MRPGAVKRITLSGTIFALLLVGGLGNQWVFEESVTDDENQWYRVLLSIADETLWIVDKAGLGDAMSSHITTRFVVAGYVGIVALLLVVASVLALGARGLGARAGGFAAFLIGWFSLVLGGAVYGLMIYAIGGDGIGSHANGYAEFHHAMLETQAGAYFGVVCGWVLGLVTAIAYASAGSQAYPPVDAGPVHGPDGRPVYAEGPGARGHFTHSAPIAYNPAYGPSPVQGTSPAYGGPPRRPQQPPRVPPGRDTHDAPTVIRPAGPPPSTPPRRPGSTDTPPGGFRP